MGRITVQFPEKTSRILTEMAESHEISKTEVLKRSLSLLHHVSKELDKDDDNKIAILDKNDNIVLEIILAD